jgi:hypothetical protein
MSHRSFPLAILFIVLLLGLPGQSFATPMDSDAASSSKSDSGSHKKDDDKLAEILKEIFTLGRLFSSGGGSRDSRGTTSSSDGSSGTDEWTEDMVGDLFTLPIIYPEDPMGGDSDLAAPVPEPTGALLFGMGILAVSTYRVRSQRQH